MATFRQLRQQEAQLSQIDRAMLRVIEYFAKSFKVIRKWACLSSTVFEIFSITLIMLDFEIRVSIVTQGH